MATESKLNLGPEAAKFRDHAVATGRTLLDWDAGFRNWLRKAAEFRGPAPPDGARHWSDTLAEELGL